MRGSIFDYVGNLDTLIAVIVGACLATGGALVAEFIQQRFSRRRRQREAARFFGELISSIVQIFDLARDSQTIGDPWGAYTVNLFRVAATESETYARNRERLYDIQDMSLRFAIHGHMLRLTVPIQSLVKDSDRIEDIRIKLDETQELSELTVASLNTRIEKLHSFRVGGLTQALEQREVSQSILARLEILAGARFEAQY